MILFMVLAIVTLLVMAIIAVVATVGGAAFIFLFGDIIVCGLLIGWIIKRIIEKKKK